MGRNAKLATGTVVVAAAAAWLLLRSHDVEAEVASSEQVEAEAFDRGRRVVPASDGPASPNPGLASSIRVPESIDRSPAKGCARSRGDEDCPFLEPDHDTLEEMARCGIARVESPSLPGVGSGTETFPASWRETAGVTDAEHEKLERAAAAFAARYREQWADLAAQAGIERAWAETSAPVVVSTRIFAEFDEDQYANAVEQVARERAGWDSTGDPTPEILDAAVRLRLGVGDAYQDAIAEAVGPARAAELRAAADGWPGAHSTNGNRCDVEPEPPRPRDFVPRTADDAEACIDDPKAKRCAFLDPTELELERMADCGMVRFDAPGFLGARFEEPTFEFDEDWADRVDLTAREAAALAELGDAFREALYRDLTGLALEAGKSQQWADQTPFLGMMIAISESSGATQDSTEAMFRRLAEERAGRVDPPADPSSRPLDERFMRRVIALGDAFEHAVAERLGPDRARTLRTADDGWPGLRLQTQNYCNGGKPQAL